MREIKFRIFGSACLKRRVNQQIHQNAASVVDEIAKSLGNQNESRRRAASAVPVDRDRNRAKACRAGFRSWLRADLHRR